MRQQLVDANVTAESIARRGGRVRPETRATRPTPTRARCATEADAYSDQTAVRDRLASSRMSAARASQRRRSGSSPTPRRRKAEIETVISDLEQRRDAVVAELDRLASEHRRDRDRSIVRRPETTLEPRGGCRRPMPTTTREAERRGARGGRSLDRGAPRAARPRRTAILARDGGLTELRAWGRAREPSSSARSRRRSPAARSATTKDRRAGQAAGPRAGRAAGRPGVVRRGGAARQLGRRRASAPTASSPAWR